MKWMGGWSWRQFLSAPSDLTDRILHHVEIEHEQLEEIRSKGAKGNGNRRFERNLPERAKPALAATTAIDPRTGREVVTKVKEDGTIVKHRKIEEGEALMHMMFGTPKSFKGK